MWCEGDADAAEGVLMVWLLMVVLSEGMFCCGISDVLLEDI